MANNSSNNQSFQQELADFRALQEEMLSLSQEYGQERQAAWADELAGLKDGWDGFSQDWQGSLAEMTALATSQFGEISAQGEAAAGQISQSWDQALTGLTGPGGRLGGAFPPDPGAGGLGLDARGGRRLRLRQRAAVGSASWAASWILAVCFTRAGW